MFLWIRLQRSTSTGASTQVKVVVLRKPHVVVMHAIAYLPSHQGHHVDLNITAPFTRLQRPLALRLPHHPKPKNISPPRHPSIHPLCFPSADSPTHLNTSTAPQHSLPPETRLAPGDDHASSHAEWSSWNSHGAMLCKSLRESF
jgi:hypothetical protein